MGSPMMRGTWTTPGSSGPIPSSEPPLPRVSTSSAQQAWTITAAWFLDPSNVSAYQRLTNYTLTPTLTSNQFEALYFNFHNVVLASHLEVRQAMAMAVDQQVLIQGPFHGFASPLCTD